ncbi:hypothetical protein ALI22I_09010 [Saccharothrix sp. ALI-22-I]|uniref:carbonic anhydrase n=1 Tax=Saccharothrix sp. ALI-22-I TaxID=1933778 RepID=UPI00097C525B|nr:carbonic anhydrase [Saccharothrix sp. ALI-22-I]ONI91465.1 hypothetical protein ALI22I_09010 [Saccharothrix sp. ALI-22-I]
MHTKVCGAKPADAGPHYQNEKDPVSPSVDPKYASPDNEIWLDFTTDDKGSATSSATVDWQFRKGDANAIVLHDTHTHTEPGKAGTAGDRLAFGDVFVTRTAGNVLSDPTVGTIEYGIVALNTPLIMVLGHQNCGAVKAAVDAMKDPSKTPPGALGALVSALVPAAREVKDRGDDIYAAALEAHIRNTVATLDANPVVKESVATGKLRVVGAAYDLATAKVTLYQ